MCLSYLLSLLLRRLCLMALDLGLPCSLQASQPKQPLPRLVSDSQFLGLKKMSGASRTLSWGLELRQNGRNVQLGLGARDEGFCSDVLRLAALFPETGKLSGIWRGSCPTQTFKKL